MTIDSAFTLTKRGIAAQREGDTPRPSAGDVLIIDDEANIRDLVVDILTDAGYAVRSATDAEDGLRAIAAATPALVLLDIHMPGMQGDELLPVLRASGYTFPIALLTAIPQTTASLTAMGSVVCVMKPFYIDELLACVARHMPPAMQELGAP